MRKFDEFFIKGGITGSHGAVGEEEEIEDPDFVEPEEVEEEE